MDLTLEQKEALLSLKSKQTGRFFTGITPETMESDLLDINQKLLTADAEHAKKLRDSERALFALCGFTPQ